ncbi:MAG: hypothetical protein R3F14_06420 [Polyangiaceae bacterium]
MKDGVEDKNHNGVVDPGETDPNNPLDDICVQTSECAIEPGLQPVTGQCVDPICDAATECPPPDTCHYVGVSSTRDGRVPLQRQARGYADARTTTRAPSRPRARPARA